MSLCSFSEDELPDISPPIYGAGWRGGRGRGRGRGGGRGGHHGQLAEKVSEALMVEEPFLSSSDDESLHLYGSRFFFSSLFFLPSFSFPFHSFPSSLINFPQISQPFILLPISRTNPIRQ